MTPDRIAIFARISQDLARAAPGSVMPVDEMVLLDVLPHFWREEVDTPEEWFIRTCRGLGLHATYDMIDRRFRVELTRDAAHEATITWPGKPSS